jgi:hypothetical protein
VNPALVATAFGDRCNAGILLQFVRAGEALALLTEGGQQPWG